MAPDLHTTSELTEWGGGALTSVSPNLNLHSNYWSSEVGRGVRRGQLRRSLASVAPDLNPTYELAEWGGGTLAPVSPNPAPASKFSEQRGWA